jgi:tetratricopeptide (TPR) repeat protein
MTERLQKLQAMLAATPDDPFLLYGIAMEHKKADDGKAALEFLDRTIAADPGYCYAYYQKGLVLESTGDLDKAKATYRDGMTAADRKGDAHARGEIEAALMLLE